MLILYSTTGCHKCKKLASLLEKMGVSFKTSYIDKDLDAQAQSIMDNIFSVPALKSPDGKIIPTTKLFDRDGDIIEETIKGLV